METLAYEPSERMEAVGGQGGAVHGVKNTKGTQAKQAFQEKRNYQLCKLPLRHRIRQKQRI